MTTWNAKPGEMKAAEGRRIWGSTVPETSERKERPQCPRWLRRGLRDGSNQRAAGRG